jgi:hypothetical protein
MLRTLLVPSTESRLSVASLPAARYIECRPRESAAALRMNSMRAEIEKLVEEIKQSVGLLRRHL